MKLEIPIIVGFDDMGSLLGDLKKLQTYKCFEGAEDVLVDIEDVAKVLMDHVKAKKSVKTDDLIRREDAIDMVKKNTFRLTFAEEQNCEGHVAWSAEAVYSDVMEGTLLDLPSANPDVPDINVGDLISRADAIDAVNNIMPTKEGFYEPCEVFEELMNCRPHSQNLKMKISNGVQTAKNTIRRNTAVIGGLKSLGRRLQN